MRHGWAVGVAVSVAVAVSGCASSTVPQPTATTSAGAPAGEVVTKAVASSLRSQVRVAATHAITTGGVTTTVTIAGVYDMSSNSGTLTADLPGGAIDSSDIVLTPDVVYVSPVAGQANGTWARSPRREVRAHFLLRTPANDPAALLHQIEHIQDVELVGEESLGDAATTHFRGTLGQSTLTTYLAADRKKLADTVLGLMGVDRLPVDVWVTADGLVSRVAIAYLVGDPDAQGLSAGFILDLRVTTDPIRVVVPAWPSTVATSDLGGILAG